MVRYFTRAYPSCGGYLGIRKLSSWVLRVATIVGWSAIVSGCTIVPEVFTISSTSDAVVPAYGRKDYGHALAAIASIMSRDFNLPVVDVLVTVYPSKASYESGAIAEGLRQRERLQQRGIKVLSEEEYIQSWKTLAVSSPAIGGYRNVHLENSRISTYRWDAWVKLLAHELTHSAQSELVRGGPSSSDRWLREGFAEWVGFKVADKFGAENFAEARQRVLDRIANARSYQTFPSLNQLVTASDWTTWMRTLGGAGTYGQSFLAVAVLVEEKGIEAMVRYFSLFGKVNNREANFLTAFGETLKSFVERFDKRLQVLALEGKSAQ